MGTYHVQVLNLAGRILRTLQAGALVAPLHVPGLLPGACLVRVLGQGFI